MRNVTRCLGLMSFMLISLIALPSWAQYATRQDVIWARSVAGAKITLDGVLDEAVWAKAESLHVIYGQPGPLPTSAYRPEFQPEAITDPTRATVKFLADGNQLYLGFIIPDSSVGGNQDWARWDGILMSIKDHRSTIRPTPAVEFFYTWWYVNIPSYVVPGAPPRFVGGFGNFNDTSRTAAQKAVWDARTVIKGGISNDNGRDEAWIVEMRIALDSLGYDLTKAEGEIAELNFSIWDCDYLFEGNPNKINSTRTWWQSPWGNANADNVGRVHVRADVTVNSGPVPVVAPDIVLENGANYPAPAIDGILDEAVWAEAYTFDIVWNDNNVRATYPGVGPYRSGQWQPEIGGARAQVLDPANATIKMFFREKYIYLAADVKDLLVQGTEVFDQFDGVAFYIGDRKMVDGDNRMTFHSLRVSFNALGDPAAYEYLPVLVDTGAVEYKVALKGATTVNNNSDIDEGFFIEMKVDLTYLGYPPDLGDQLLFMGVLLGDGDSFDDPLKNYGTRTWWFREYSSGPACAWMVMDPNILLSVDQRELAAVPATIELFDNYPNPFNPSTKVRYSIPFGGEVTLKIFNVLGQMVAENRAFQLNPGFHELAFDARGLSSGLYFYQVEIRNMTNNNVVRSRIAKMALVK